MSTHLEAVASLGGGAGRWLEQLCPQLRELRLEAPEVVRRCLRRGVRWRQRLCSALATALCTPAPCSSACAPFQARSPSYAPGSPTRARLVSPAHGAYGRWKVNAPWWLLVQLRAHAGAQLFGAVARNLGACRAAPCRAGCGAGAARITVPAKKLLARRVSACHTRLLPRHLLRGVRQLDVRGSSVPVNSRAPCLTSTFSGWTGAATWCALTPLFACASAAGFRVCAQLCARVSLRNSCANRSASAMRIRRLSTKSSSWTRSGARVRWRTAL